jgi:hypothetical protein
VTDWVQSLLFWAIFLGIIGFSIIYYLRQRAGLRRFIDRTGARSWWFRFWTWLKISLFRAQKQVARAIAGSLSWLGASEDAGLGDKKRMGPQLGRLAPRERVLRIYLAMLHKAEERGIRRRASQTPAEFARVLEQTFPEINPEVDALTDSFVEARYSLHEITPADASFIARCWARVRAAITRTSSPD